MRRFVRNSAAVALAYLVAVITVHAQSWSVQINKPNRFTVLAQFNSQAVLDNETGLVWEKTPSTTKYAWNVYPTAHIACDVKVLGNRVGWRLPTIQELGSLLDPTRARPPLPLGHPFTLNTDQATLGEFWSATSAETDSTSPNSAWFVSFYVLDPNSLVLYGAGDKSTQRYVWCVRTGSGLDNQ